MGDDRIIDCRVQICIFLLDGEDLWISIAFGELAVHEWQTRRER